MNYALEHDEQDMNFPASITTTVLCIYSTVQIKQNKALMKFWLREHLRTRQLDATVSTLRVSQRITRPNTEYAAFYTPLNMAQIK